MAVEIPVVVDIEKAFNDAATRVGTAIRPLKQEINRQTADLVINVASEGERPNLQRVSEILKTVKDNYGDINFAAEHLNNAIREAKARYDELYVSQAKGKTLSIAKLEEMEALRNAIVLLESEANLRTKGSRIASEEAQRQLAVVEAIDKGNYALERETKTMADLSDKISSLRGKLQNIDPKSKEWGQTAKEIEKATKELSKYEQKLSVLSKPGSVDRIREEMSKLESQWNAMSKRVKFDENGNLSKSAQRLVDKFKALTAESEKYGQSLSATAAKAKPAVESTTAAMRSQSTVLSQLTSMASMYISVFGLFRFAKQLRDVTGELEYQRVALGRLIQDEQYGAALFEKIKDAAQQSPFRITQLVTYTKQLAAYRIEQENLFDTTMRLADISAGLGVEMNRLILAYGQVRAASVLRGQELRQFTEAGIPLVDLLADKMGELNKTTYTTADVFKLISERAVPFSAIADIFEDLTDKGGMFYKMQEKQAETIKGKWEKLKDAFDVGLQAAGETKTFAWQNKLALDILTVLAKNIRIVPKLIESIGFAWVTYSAAAAVANLRNKQVAKSAIEVMTAKQLMGAGVSKASIRLLGYERTTRLVTKANAALAASNGILSRTFAKLTLAMLSNPYAAVAAAVIGLASAFVFWRKESESAITSLSDYKVALDNFATAEKQFEKNEKLIDRYEELASKTERTEKENNKLYATISKLQDAFPGMTSKIDAQTESLKKNVEALREKNKEELAQSKDEAKKALNAAIITRNSLQTQLDELLQQREDAYKKMKEQDALVNFYGYGSQKNLDEAVSKYNELDQKVQETKNNISDLNKTIGSLENYISPKVADEATKGWKDQVRELNTYKTSLGSIPLFTPQEIDDLESVYDYYKKLKKLWTDSKTSLEGLKEAYENATEPLIKAKLLTEVEDEQARFDAIERAREFYGFIFNRGSGGGSRQTDPFVTRMQERIKFMQDFKKGYDDLSKYMAKSGALGKESEIMLGRGMSLGLSENDQKKAAENLSEWYDDMIKAVSERLKSKGVKGTSVTDLLGIDTTKRSKDIQDLQKLLQSLWDAKTDFDTSETKKSIEDALKKLSDEIKRSETARNFYRDILDLTGDEDLAADMSINVYGDIGREFKDRLRKELNSALADFDDQGDISLFEKMKEALNAADFDTIFKYLDRFPEEWQKRLKEMSESNEKYNADLIKNLLKALESAKTYGEKQVEIAKQTAKRISDINALNAPQDVKDNLLKQNAKKEAEDTARIQYEAFKESPMYVELFADLESASTRMLQSMKENLVKLKAQWKDLSPKELKELQSRIKEIDDQLATKNPFKALVESIREYRELTQKQSRLDADTTASGLTDYAELQKSLLELAKKNYTVAVEKYGAISDEAKVAKEQLDVQSEETDLAIEQANKAQETANSYRSAVQQIIAAADAMSKFNNYIDEALDGVGEIVKAFGSADAIETFDIVSQGISKTLGGLTTTASSAARLFAGDMTAIPGLIKGIGDSISGIFGTSSQLKIKAIDKEIEKQGRLLDDLSYSYSRLEYAMSKAFGAEYIYNYGKQLENLSAQADAYRAQAEAEQSKGKKADDDKIKEYQNSARDVEDKIAEMRTQLSEFFAGTDLTSAAEDFANAWIEAYKEFGSTTDAMSEKFNDMIQSMINRSLAAKIMQEMLQPIFDQIDTMAGDGLLATDEIASIAALAQERIPLINDAMTNLMTSLASAGLDVRTATSGFKGISKDIAGASEESILGLAAGINTQNFYMSYVPTISENVSQILAAMTGGVSPTAPVETNEAGEVLPSVQRMVYDHLPNMDSNLSEILRLFKSVITTKSSSTNTNYVAVR